MADFDNTNRGALFRPKERRSEAAPQWRGTVNVNGVDWELSIWEKTSKNGLPFLSCAFKPPYVAPEGTQKPAGGFSGRGSENRQSENYSPSRAALGPTKGGSITSGKTSYDLDDDLPF